MKNENMFIDGIKIIEFGVTPVAEDAVVYLESFELPHVAGADFSIVAKGSGTTIDVAFDLEIGDVKPATEGAADDNFAVPDDMSTIFTIEDALLHRKTITPTVGKYGRLKLTGSVTNAADVSFSKINIIMVID